MDAVTRMQSERRGALCRGAANLYWWLMTTTKCRTKCERTDAEEVPGADRIGTHVRCARRRKRASRRLLLRAFAITGGLGR